jgi:hypothetical protein
MGDKYRIEKIVYPGLDEESSRTKYYPQYSYKSFWTKKVKWVDFTYGEYMQIRQFNELDSARAWLDDYLAKKDTPIHTIIDYP